VVSHQGDIIILNVYTTNDRPSEYMKLNKMIELQGEIDKSTVTVGDFNALPSITDKTCR